MSQQREVIKNNVGEDKEWVQADPVTLLPRPSIQAYSSLFHIHYKNEQDGPGARVDAVNGDVKSSKSRKSREIRKSRKSYRSIKVGKLGELGKV